MDLTLEQISFRLIAALVLSAVIGLERQVHEKPAGIRTHALVGLGATIMTICGVLVASVYGNDGNTVSVDPSRLASVVIQGIGFIGAGVIIQSRGSVKGLTSAATLWFVAALGIAVGFGFWEMAAAATIMALLLLIIFRKHEEEAELLELLNRENANCRKSGKKKNLPRYPSSPRR
jgi:putative Mg2+ transporter-C (MgtC) family protein